MGYKLEVQNVSVRIIWWVECVVFRRCSRRVENDVERQLQRFQSDGVGGRGGRRRSRCRRRCVAPSGSVSASRRHSSVDAIWRWVSFHLIPSLESPTHLKRSWIRARVLSTSFEDRRKTCSSLATFTQNTGFFSKCVGKFLDLSEHVDFIHILMKCDLTEQETQGLLCPFFLSEAILRP